MGDLPNVGFSRAKEWSVRNGDRLGDVKDRTVAIFERGKLQVVSLKGKGGPRPPKSEDVLEIRGLLQPYLD